MYCGVLRRIRGHSLTQESCLCLFAWRVYRRKSSRSTWKGIDERALEDEAFCQTMLDTQTEGWLDSLTRFQLGGGARILQPRLPHPLLMPVSHVDGAPRPPHTPHRLPECRVAAHEMREMMFGAADSIMQPATRAAPKWEALGR